MKLKNAILLNGSPKINRSTSEALSDFMANRFVEEGLEIRQARISSHLKSEEKTERLVQHIKVSDLICLISPLYVDSLPYNVIECMEVIQAHMGHKDQNAETVFMAICQSGMEQDKNLIALQTCECFAKTLGFQFAGAFAIGFAGILNGLPLKQLNRLTRNVQKSLSIVSENIANGNPVPKKQVDMLLAKPLLPGPLYAKLFLFNATMKNCKKKKSFNKGIEQLHSRLKLFYS